MQAESTIRADVAVIGAGLGGCAAALAAARSGRRVILTEETRWIGGQLTSQAVPPDEHPWIEHFGASASYGFSVREPGPAAPDINPEEYHALLANAADYIVDRLDADIVFVSMERTDIQHSHAVVAHMHNEGRAEVLRRTHLSADSCAPQPLRVCCRHAASFFDLCGVAWRSVHRASLCLKDHRLSPRSWH
jgi:choline dehydrogenase-like flavoprotein